MTHNGRMFTVGIEIEWSGAPATKPPRGWHSESDASLPAGGVEWVSPILADGAIEQAGLAFARGQQAEGWTGPAAGLHVHVGHDGGFTPRQAAAIALLWSERCGEITAAHRRQYAKAYTEGQLAALEKAESREDVLNAIGADPQQTDRAREGFEQTGEVSRELKYDPARYRQVNLVAWAIRGAIEFRAFDGPSSAEEVEAAVALVLAVCAEALGEGHDVESSLERYIGLRTDTASWSEAAHKQSNRARIQYFLALARSSATVEAGDEYLSEAKHLMLDNYTDMHDFEYELDEIRNDLFEREGEELHKSLTEDAKRWPSECREVYYATHAVEEASTDELGDWMLTPDGPWKAEKEAETLKGEWDEYPGGPERWQDEGLPLVVRILAFIAAAYDGLGTHKARRMAGDIVEDLVDSVYWDDLEASDVALMSPEEISIARRSLEVIRWVDAKKYAVPVIDSSFIEAIKAAS